MTFDPEIYLSPPDRMLVVRFNSTVRSYMRPPGGHWLLTVLRERSDMYDLNNLMLGRYWRIRRQYRQLPSGEWFDYDEFQRQIRNAAAQRSGLGEVVRDAAGSPPADLPGACVQ